MSIEVSHFKIWGNPKYTVDERGAVLSGAGVLDFASLAFPNGLIINIFTIKCQSRAVISYFQLRIYQHP